MGKKSGFSDELCIQPGIRFFYSGFFLTGLSASVKNSRIFWICNVLDKKKAALCEVLRTFQDSLLKTWSLGFFTRGMQVPCLFPLMFPGLFPREHPAIRIAQPVPTLSPGSVLRILFLHLRPSPSCQF